MTTERTRQLVSAYYEAWIGGKGVNHDVLKQTFHEKLVFRGSIDALDGADNFIRGVEEFAQICGRVDLISQLIDGEHATTLYRAHITPLGEDMVFSEHVTVADDRIAKIDLVFDSIPFRPLIAAARAGANPSKPKRVGVRYKVKADKGEENTSYVEKVFAELAETKPSGFRYTSLRGADGVSFVHIASMDGENPLSDSPAFKAFQETLKDRVEEAPHALGVEPVGSYGFE